MQSSEPIRIIGISAIRNEADVIEAFVRHNLQYCTEILLLNQGSTDSTLEILESLRHEGLPVLTITDATMGDRQVTNMNRLMNLAVRDYAADWIVCLDGDEFIQGPLEESLRKRHKNGIDDGGTCYRIRLVNYRAQPSDRTDTLNPVERIAHYEAGELRPSSIYATKVLFSRALAIKEGALIGKGNHQISVSGIAVPFEWLDEVSLAHYPLRSPSQFGNKIATQVLQQYFQRDRQAAPHPRIETPYQKMREGYSAFAEGFYESRAIWVSSATDGAVNLVKQPAEYKGGQLRHTSGQADTDQLIRNLLNLAEDMASQYSLQASSTTVEASSPTITLSLCKARGVDHVNVQTFSVSTTAFSTLRLSLQNQEFKDRIHIGVSAGRGLLEICEVIVKYADGQSRTLNSDELPALLSINHNGLYLNHPAYVRFAMGMVPVMLTLAGEKVFLAGAPAELTFKARLVVDPQRISMALIDTMAIRSIHTTFTSNADHRIRYTMGEQLTFGDSGDGIHFLRTGWSPPQHWGVWSKDDFSTIYLRLDRPTTSDLTLSIQIRRRSKDTPVKLGISIDQERVLTTVLEEDSAQWLTIPIPANRWGRCDLDLSFQIEEPKGANPTETRRELGIGIKRLRLEEKSPYRKVRKAVRTLYLSAADRLSRTLAKSGINLGHEIDFHRQGCGLSLLRQGWAPPTETGCLIERNSANLEMRLPRPRKEALTLKLLIRACQGIGADDAALALEIDGRQIAAWEIPASASGWLEAVIPPSEIPSKRLSLQLRRKAGNFELRKLTLQKKRTKEG